MLFQNPAMLWGLLSLTVPIVLHFWHQQRAIPIPWAMMRWLEMPAQPPKRGFRFDNWLMLLLRCLLLTLLVWLLARPLVPPPPGAASAGRVHLVEPDSRVVQAYRFELEQALARQERVCWATAPTTPVSLLAELPADLPMTPLRWQTAITGATGPTEQLHTYLLNSPAWAEAPQLNVPADFQLHTVDVAPIAAANRAVALPAGKRLVAGTDGRLRVSEQPTPDEQIVATAPLRVLLSCRQPAQRVALSAALRALSAVYGIPFGVDEKPVTAGQYAWVLVDTLPAAATPGTLYTVLGRTGTPHQPNVTYLPEWPTPQTSDLVAAGQLPEWLAGNLARHLGLVPSAPPLPEAQLTRLFVPIPAAEKAGVVPAHPENDRQTALLVLFLAFLLLERYLSIRRRV